LTPSLEVALASNEYEEGVTVSRYTIDGETNKMCKMLRNLDTGLLLVNIIYV